jgi:hypothetical protein
MLQPWIQWKSIVRVQCKNPRYCVLQWHLDTSMQPKTPSDHVFAHFSLLDSSSQHRDWSNCVFNRDNLIEQLQQEIARLRMEIQRLIHEHQRIVDQLNQKIGELQVDLATKVLTDCIPYYNVCVCVRVYVGGTLLSCSRCDAVLCFLTRRAIVSFSRKTLWRIFLIHQMFCSYWQEMSNQNY